MSVDPAPAPKLTKKQRKGQAFREKKGKGRATRPEPEDVPEAENLDAQAEDDERIENLNSREKKQSDKEKTKTTAKGKGKEKENAESEPKSAQKKDSDAPSKKRKRSESDEQTDAAVDIDAGSSNLNPNPNANANADSSKVPKSKKRKSKPTATDENAEAGESKKEPENARYILFVGNLKYTTSKETIEAHFAQCDPPPTIRLLTPKPSSPSAPSHKSKGCAFLEFTHRNALQQALKLHHSSLDGRQINVELTAGGGGKSATRLEKVRGRNRELEVQRTKRQQKESAKSDSPAQPTVTPSLPQRHSSTSGTIDAPAARRTWSIPEAGDEEGTHRGGVKHAKKRGEKKGGRGRKEREWGTGVNAIPVG